MVVVARILPCMSPGTDGFRGIEVMRCGLVLMARLGPARSGSLGSTAAARWREESASNTLSVFSAKEEVAAWLCWSQRIF